MGVWADPRIVLQEHGYRWILDGLAEIVLPELTSLSIATKQYSRYISHSICQVLLSRLGIETLRMETGPGLQWLEVLRAAGQLPLLRQFEMEDTRLIAWPELDDPKEPEIISLPESLFPAVESLKLSGAPDFLVPLLSRVSSANVRSVRLVAEFQYRDHEPKGHWDTPLADTFCAIGRFTHLKAL